MMFAVIPKRYMGMKASRIATGMVTMGTTADGTCHRKSRITRLTMTSAVSSSCRSVSTASVMSRERS
jgi:hypothetical protein